MSCGSTALFCLPCLEKEGELGDMKTWGGGGEPERESPRCKNDILRSQKGKDGQREGFF